MITTCLISYLTSTFGKILFDSFQLRFFKMYKNKVLVIHSIVSEIIFTEIAVYKNESRKNNFKTALILK